MTRRRLIGLLLAVFVAAESAAILLGLYAFHWSGGEPRMGISAGASLRIGILPEVSKADSRIHWQPLVDDLAERHRMDIKVYFAASPEELTAGFRGGAVDAIFVNSALYLEILADGTTAAALVYQKRDLVSPQGDSPALVTTTGHGRFISETEGYRLSLTAPQSLSGHIVPMEYMRRRLPRPPEVWFSSISFAGTDLQAVIDLLEDKTDLVALDMRNLAEIVEERGIDTGKLRVVWTVRDMPGKVLVVNPESPRADLMRKMFPSDTAGDGLPRLGGMILAPVDHAYREQLQNFEEFISRGDGEKD